MKTRFLCCLLLFSALTAAPAATPEASRPRVTLTAGTLEGTLPQGAPGAAFMGIPFAQPPVGELRWREPLAVKSWQGVRDAAASGEMCAQLRGNGPAGSEDCLYLNVWTPEWPLRSQYPVMLWSFGGANYTGSANNPVFDGAALAKHGVVVVTANFRVGALGFMAHPALSAESPHRSSGNYMLLDQLMALRWIRDNIAKFGGNPQHVTLFGQSSGSYDVFLLMTSPLAKGLFVNAIAQSGQFLSYEGSMPKARAEDIGKKIAADLKVPEGAKELEQLRSLPAEQVMTAAAKWMPTNPGSDTGLLTNVDGWVLPELPARVFSAGKQMSIPMIIGNNSREISPQLSADEVRQQITAKYGDLAPQALAAYGLANGGAGNNDPLLGGVAAQWMTDIVQRCGAVVETQWHAAAKNPTWQYQFERAIPGRESLGSTHGAEVAFVFGNLDRVPNTPAFTDADRQASTQMQEYWTRFAKTGNPNGGALPEWPRAGDDRYMAFTAEGPMVKSKLQTEPCRVYREWMLQRLAK